VPVCAINLIDDRRLVFASVAGSQAGRWGEGTDRAGSLCEALLLPQVSERRLPPRIRGWR
jgi:hypothetical protein